VNYQRPVFPEQSLCGTRSERIILYAKAVVGL
jgi:hypothetical protein